MSRRLFCSFSLWSSLSPVKTVIQGPGSSWSHSQGFYPISSCRHIWPRFVGLYLGCLCLLTDMGPKLQLHSFRTGRTRALDVRSINLSVQWNMFGHRNPCALDALAAVLSTCGVHESSSLSGTLNPPHIQEYVHVVCTLGVCKIYCLCKYG